MPRKDQAYDNVFKTLKLKHKRLFIPVINEAFGKRYPLDADIEIKSSEGYLTESETNDGSKRIKEQISDFLLKLGEDIYLLECQSFDDDSMAIRIAEYAFISARQFATWDIGHAVIPLPKFVVIYVKRTKRTPDQTRITFIFPDGQQVDYVCDNVILENFTKEYIVEKRLFPYIPFYIARYEKIILEYNKYGKKESQKKKTLPDLSPIIRDLEYFRDAIYELHGQGELTDGELVDLKGLVNTIITHITDGNKAEERLVNIMGGTVLETESERLRREGKMEGKMEGKIEGIAQGIIETGREAGWADESIMEKLLKKLDCTNEKALEYMKQYG